MAAIRKDVHLDYRAQTVCSRYESGDFGVTSGALHDNKQGISYRATFRQTREELVQLAKYMIVEAAIEKEELFEMSDEKTLAVANEVAECAQKISRVVGDREHQRTRFGCGEENVIRANATRLLALAARLRGKNGVPEETEAVTEESVCEARLAGQRLHIGVKIKGFADSAQSALASGNECGVVTWLDKLREFAKELRTMTGESAEEPEPAASEPQWLALHIRLSLLAVSLSADVDELWERTRIPRRSTPGCIMAHLRRSIKDLDNLAITLEPDEPKPTECTPLCAAHEQSWLAAKAKAAEKIENEVVHIRQGLAEGERDPAIFYALSELATLAKDLRSTDAQQVETEPDELRHYDPADSIRDASAAVKDVAEGKKP